MIQEKDFLYRVPVKNVLVATPRQQARNPEILVDVEGGEFMHGNILDANSTNKLINQSVKDAVDNKLIESGYVTKDLLEAETTRATEQENSLKTLIGAEISARTKGNEYLSSKINAEQTRAEGKEKEISDKLAIVNGDSNTEGSFRKAIADVVAAAPEDLDTLKEIADKLAGNDDLHTALNKAITEKADATALSNYVLTTALDEQVDTLNAAISAKQDAGNYIPYDDQYKQVYIPDRTLRTIGNNIEAYSIGGNDQSILQPGNILVEKIDGNSTHTAKLNTEGLTIRNAYKDIHIDKDGFGIFDSTDNHGIDFIIQKQGISLRGGDNNHVLTSNSGTIDITQYALKSELPTVPTKTSQLTNDSNFIQASLFDEDGYYLSDSLNFGLKNNGVITIDGSGIRSDVGEGFSINYTGIRFNGRLGTEIPTAGGSFIKISSLASAEDISNLSVGLSKKQDKITVNEVDITDIETADITKLRTIVTNLINALSASGLIRETQTLE